MNQALNRRQLLAALGSAGLAGAAPRAFGQDAAWPAKPVSYIVPLTPGGSTDVIGRTLCQKLQDALGQPFVVDNKPGAAGAVGATYAAPTRPTHRAGRPSTPGASSAASEAGCGVAAAHRCP